MDSLRSFPRARVRRLALIAPVALLATLAAPIPASAGVFSAAGLRCTIVGTSGDDKLAGTPGKDVICGLGGNDKINGGGGNDIVDDVGGLPFPAGSVVTTDGAQWDGVITVVANPAG